MSLPRRLMYSLTETNPLYAMKLKLTVPTGHLTRLDQDRDW
jgi:hypothetical protein